MDNTTHKQIKQLETKVERLEKLTQRLINQNRIMDAEIRRLKHADRQAMHQISAVERKLG